MGDESIRDRNFISQRAPRKFSEQFPILRRKPSEVGDPVFQGDSRNLTTIRGNSPKGFVDGIEPKRLQEAPGALIEGLSERVFDLPSTDSKCEAKIGNGHGLVKMVAQPFLGATGEPGPVDRALPFAP